MMAKGRRPSRHRTRRGDRLAARKARARAFVDVGPELDPDVARAGFGGVSSSKREGHKAAPLRRGRGFGESDAERAAKENELRWRKERREREKRKLEDERRRFEVLQLELEAIEARRLEQARAREDKKAAEAELRSAREENKSSSDACVKSVWRGRTRASGSWPSRWSDAAGCFPASLWAFMKLGLGANPCTCACRRRSRTAPRRRRRRPGASRWRRDARGKRGAPKSRVSKLFSRIRAFRRNAADSSRETNST